VPINPYDPDLYEEDGFSWRLSKADQNLRKHKISFDEAKLIFSDIMIVDLGEDRRGNYGEQRFNSIGRTRGNTKMHVTYTYENEDRIHIISARPLQPHEERAWTANNPLINPPV
jgi:uncharacterized DUF497 family protein